MKVSAGLTLLLISSSCVGQTNPSPHFEVASVKSVSRDVRMGFSGGPGSSDPGRVSYARIDLANLIGNAYNVKIDQISGPSWLSTEWYSVAAKLPPGTTMAQFRQMMANLLAERFGLAFHRLSKEVSGYEIMVASGGPRLVSSPPNTTATAPWQVTVEEDQAQMVFQQASMMFLADRLSAAFNGFRSASATTPMIDRTGLTGKFDFRLEFAAPLSAVPEASPDGRGGMMIINQRDVNPKVISAALEKQLGLKLNAAKMKVDFLLIDHVERVPTPN